MEFSDLAPIRYSCAEPLRLALAAVIRPLALNLACCAQLGIDNLCIVQCAPAYPNLIPARVRKIRQFGNSIGNRPRASDSRRSCSDPPLVEAFQPIDPESHIRTRTALLPGAGISDRKSLVDGGNTRTVLSLKRPPRILGSATRAGTLLEGQLSSETKSPNILKTPARLSHTSPAKCGRVNVCDSGT